MKNKASQSSGGISPEEASSADNPFYHERSTQETYDEGFDPFKLYNEMFGLGESMEAEFDGKERGDDLELSLALNFQDAVHGMEKKIRYERLVRCAMCHGSGKKKGTQIITCNNCKGTGFGVTSLRGVVNLQGVCEDCRGLGQFIDRCVECHGTGVITDYCSMDCKIPAGVTNGDTITYYGKGNAGFNSGEFGDAIVRLEVRQDKIFDQRGLDIFLIQYLDILTASTGGTIYIPTIHGKVKVELPAGIQHDDEMTLKGMGIKTEDGKGDQWIRFQVEVPKKLQNPDLVHSLEEFHQLESAKLIEAEYTEHFDNPEKDEKQDSVQDIETFDLGEEEDIEMY